MTVNDLMESKRLEIAVDMFKHDPMLLKAILIELGMESLNVAKNAIVREVGKYGSLDYFELKPMLTQFSDFQTFNIYWGMSEVEKIYYSKNPKGELSKEEAVILFDKIKKQYGLD